jgi:uncharacterized membrane protein YbhN (UPF0104 family)
MNVVAGATGAILGLAAIIVLAGIVANKWAIAYLERRLPAPPGARARLLPPPVRTPPEPLGMTTSARGLVYGTLAGLAFWLVVGGVLVAVLS